MVCGGGGGTRIYVDVVSARAVPVTTTQYQPDPRGVKVTTSPPLTSPQSTLQIFQSKHSSHLASGYLAPVQCWSGQDPAGNKSDQRTCKPMK